MPHDPSFGSLAGELRNAGLVLLAFGVLFVAAETWRRLAHPPAEWTRKFVHLGGGLVCAAFPFLFAHALTVFVIAALSLGTMALARSRGLLSSVTGVERRTRGEAWFPIAVAVLFAAARTHPVFYLIALSALVLSDTAAALIGRAYGRFAYASGEDRKSLEGSAVFAVVTFLAVHVALLLGTPIDRAASLLVAAQIALLVTSFESISLRGNDNVVVPLGTFYLLLKMAHQPVETLAFQLSIQVGLLAGTLALAWRTRFLSFAGAVATHLVLYAAFSLGGPLWTFAPLGALTGFLWVDARHRAAGTVPEGGHQVRAIYYTSIVAVLALFADNSFATLLHGPESLRVGHPFHPVFVGALAGPLAIVAFETGAMEPGHRHRPEAARIAQAFLLALVAVALPGLAVFGTHVVAETIVVALLVPAASLALHLGLRRFLRPVAAARLRAAAASTLIAAAVALVLHFLWLGLRPWALP